MPVSTASIILLAGSFACDVSVEPSIVAFELDAAGQARLIQRVPAANPGFFHAHPSRPLLYAVSEKSGVAAEVIRFAITDTGGIERVDAVPAGGAAPCHVDGDGRWLAVANYNGGTARFFRLSDDGGFAGEPFTFSHEGSGPNPKRQKSPHPHGAHFSPDGSLVAVPDLGTDEVVVYRLDPGGAPPARAAALRCPPGSGPRHAAFHTEKNLLYILTELGNELLVASPGDSVEAVEPRILSSHPALPPGYEGASAAAEILLHPGGKLLAASNRGHDSIVFWPLDSEGRPGDPAHHPAGGKTPRSMAFSPDGTLLAAGLQGSGEVVLFRVDEANVRISEIGRIAIASPVAVALIPRPKTWPSAAPVTPQEKLPQS